MAIKHTIRTAEGGTKEVTLTPRTAIKNLCIECMGFQQREVKLCSSPQCPVYPFRNGEAHTGRKGNPDAFKDATQVA